MSTKPAAGQILTAYMDESGMGEEEYLTMGGFIGKLGQWHAFSKRWNTLLRRETIPYAHLVEMERRAGPFAKWDTPDIARFYRKGFKLVEKHAIMGVTCAVHKDTYRAAYRDNFPPKTSPDSMYGLLTRVMIEFFTGWLDKHVELPQPRINLIFDRQKQGGNGARAVFNEIKDLYDDAGRVLGDFSFGDLKDHSGLQIADYLVARARREEATAEESGIRRPTDEPLPKGWETGRARVLHFDVNPEVFEIFRKEKVDLRRRKRWLQSQIAKADAR